MKSATSVEYVPIRYVIRFIAYRMNWSIVRVAEWLLARDFEQYISAYREKEDSKYYEINDINDIDDIATSYLLKRTLDMGHSAICSEGEKEDNKNFYKAYYKMKNINNHHILDELGLDFNEIYDFNFYNTDIKGFVTAINKKLSDITDVLIIPTPSVTPTKSDPYEQYLVELNQLRINNIRNNPNTDSIEQQLIDALAKIDKLEQSQADGSFSISNPAAIHGKSKINDQLVKALTVANAEIKHQEQDIKKLNSRLKEQAKKLTEDKLLPYNSQMGVARMLHTILTIHKYDLSATKGKANSLIENASQSNGTPVTRNFIAQWIELANQAKSDSTK